MDSACGPCDAALRLTQQTAGNGVVTTQSFDALTDRPDLFTYDPIGNLLSKSDVGTYTYPLAGAALPHQRHHQLDLHL
jgi:hypothetical protein